MSDKHKYIYEWIPEKHIKTVQVGIVCGVQTCMTEDQKHWCKHLNFDRNDRSKKGSCRCNLFNEQLVRKGTKDSIEAEINEALRCDFCLEEEVKPVPPLSTVTEATSVVM